MYSNSYAICQLVPFQMTLVTPNRFQGQPLFDVEYLSNGTRLRHSYGGMLTGS